MLRPLQRRKQTKHHHGYDTARIKKMHEKTEGQRSQGRCGRTMGAPTPLGAPPGLGFRLGAHAYVGILVMLVSDYDLIGSQRDKAKMH